MANPYFRFKQFTVCQDRTAMKVTTDGCLFGAWAADRIANKANEPGNILDIGTGTGLLSLMVAQRIKVSIDAVEIDPEAVVQARENILSSPWKESIHIIDADIRSFDADKSYSFIICNPPFYTNEWKGPDERKNVAHHSSSLEMEDLLQIIHQKLNTGSYAFLLLPFKRWKELEPKFAAVGLPVTHTCRVRQSPGHDFFRVMIECVNGATPGLPTEETITIRENGETYSQSFTELLRDYYLYL